MNKNIPFQINLQLFAGEKTEKATPKRKQEARKKGQVAKSNEIITVIVLTMTILLLRFWLPNMLNDFNTLFQRVFQYTAAEFTVNTVFVLLNEVLYYLAKMLLPILIIALTAGYLGNVVQVGFLFTTEPLKFDLNRLNPISGFKRIFSKRAIAELFKSLLKTGMVGYAAFSYLWEQLPKISLLMEQEISVSMGILGDIVFNTGLRILAVLLVIAMADYVYQRYEYEDSLKMSKQEVKDEYKNIEGDPQLKAKIKEKQRQLAMRRMMEEVPQATVIITNPTHIAVALKYKDEMKAPVLVAKGQDFIAQRIKDIAADNKVTIVENKPLARQLYKTVDIGQSIPAELYQAVAEVIAYVYKMKKSY